ncbi:MAG: hypothetical protein K2P88_15390 [Chitinophagaceae bacterium]|uniref:hypothetical protein n=1 Tax=unclassified Paraflavitalea TaxID=2798305 RepID=UPI003D340C71|nr:hypothetical protein [Chitinophagaceae bacterium]
MNRILLLLSIVIFSSFTSKPKSYQDALNQLFFGIQMNYASPTFVGDFKKHPLLWYEQPVVKRSLEATVAMNDPEATSVTYEFKMKEDPISTIKATAGKIELSVASFNKKEKIIGLNWQMSVETAAEAQEFYKALVEHFGDYCEITSREKEADELQSAVFISKETAPEGMKQLSVLITKSINGTGYDIFIVPGSSFV